jgi:hypothetical protein
VKKRKDEIDRHEQWWVACRYCNQLTFQLANVRGELTVEAWRPSRAVQDEQWRGAAKGAMP